MKEALTDFARWTALSIAKIAAVLTMCVTVAATIITSGSALATVAPISAPLARATLAVAMFGGITLVGYVASTH